MTQQTNQSQTQVQAQSQARTPLHMIHAEVSVPDFQRWMATRNLTELDHAIHYFLTECFGKDDAPRPFRLVVPRGSRAGELYGYSPADSGQLREAIELYGSPRQQEAMPPQGIQHKTMPDQWRAGRRLGFETRICPTARANGGGTSGLKRGADRDLYQWTLSRVPAGEKPPTQETVYAAWLRRQFELNGGAQLETAKLTSFINLLTKRQISGKTISVPSAVMNGQLTITDPEQFKELLAKGIGKHKAYGYGMIRLRPLGNT